MMVLCAVVNCSSRSNRDHVNGIRFFTIPKVIKNQCDLTRQRSERRRALWIARINRKDLQEQDVKDYTKVCSLHFASGKPAPPFDETNPDWAPSLKLGHGVSSLGDSSRYERRKRRASKELNFSDLNNSAPPEPEARPEENSLPAIESDCAIATFDVGEPQGGNIPSLQENATDVPEVLDSTPDYHFAPETHQGPADKPLSEYDTLMKQYLELCQRLRKLRDQVTELEVDKLEMEAKLNSCKVSQEAMKREKMSLEKENQHLKEQCKVLSTSKVEFQKNIESLNQKIEELTSMSKKLESCTFHSLESFSSNDEKVKFYTGLPSFSMFQVVLKRVSPHLKQSKNYVLEPWQSMLLSLIRLRLAVPLQDLAYRFGVSVATACRVFEKYVHAMYISLYPVLVHWPDRETLWKTMPTEFKEAFGKSVAVIIDGFEIFTEKPSSLETRAMIWSNYKHHHSVKIVMGITPTGAISFVSLAWGGRVSDKHLTAHSGLYDLLLPNDVVMADRGFDISEDVAFFCAKVLIPAFTRGQKQLSSHDVGLTRKIAHLRIHVERVIGLVRRKYTILQSVLPVELLTKRNDNDIAPIDEIVRVCCALTNLSNSVVVSTNNQP